MTATLQLTNPSHISQKDIQTLANYNPAAGLVAIQYRKGTSSIVNLHREEVTCFQIFLSFLNLGELANKQFELHKIVKHLDQFNWSYAKNQDKSSDLYKAYNTMCLLGKKCYNARSYKWEPSDVWAVKRAERHKKFDS